MPQFKFPKDYKLCSKNSIAQVFSMGKTAMFYPLQFRYLPVTGSSAVRIMVSAPKKRFKHAVVRNRLKRLMREAYRLNRHIVCREQTEQKNGLYIVCCCIGPQETDFATIRQSMVKGLEHIAQHTKKHNGTTT